MPGADNLTVEARAALLDAVAALEAHKNSVILIGAQAIYLHTGHATFAIAEATKDSDLAIDARALGEDPLLEEAMTRAGFILNPVSGQPGAWMSPNGIPVDLMVPENLAGSGSRRGVRIPPHDKHSARRAAGLEAAIIDQTPMRVQSLDGDGRSAVINVAGPAALLVAKLHKLGERVDSPDRLNNKDAHDIYRLFVATETSESPRPYGNSSQRNFRSALRPGHSGSYSSSSPRDQMLSDRRWRAEPKKVSASRTPSRPPSASWPRICCRRWLDQLGLLNRVGPVP